MAMAMTVVMTVWLGALRVVVAILVACLVRRAHDYGWQVCIP